MDINESKNLNIRPPKEALWALVIFLAVLTIFFAVKIKSEWSGLNRLTQPPSISVSGEGKALAKPDVAVIDVGVLKESGDLLSAQKSAAEAMDKVSAMLKNKNVEDKDIKTTAYSINPRYDYNNSARIFRGYEVFQNTEVKIRDLGKVGEIISGAAEAGANQIGSLSFSVDDPAKAQNEARASAISEAKSKAEKLAGELGIRLGKLLNYSEAQGGMPPPIYYGKAAGMGGPSIAPTISEGENEINISVTLTYEIK